MDDIEALWDAYAEEYDAEPDHGLLDADVRTAWKELLRTWLPSRPGLIGDFACGTGTLSVIAAELGHHVVGFDLSGEMVRRAQAKTAPFGAAVQIDKADVARPPVEDGSLDAVLARHILWTLPDPEDALARWARAVRPGGRLVLIEGQWGSEAAEAGAQPGMPWRAGVGSAQLREALAPLAGHIRVVQLSDPVYWGRDIDHERYLLVAELEGSRV